MPPRAQISFPVQIAAAVLLGVGAGALIGWSKAASPSAWLAEQAFTTAGFVALAWLRALAVPLIISSVVLGSAGLEPMRGMGRLVGKTLAWMVGTCLLAVLTAVVVAVIAGPHPVAALPLYGQGRTEAWADTFYWSSGWLGLVLLSLAFGYYRNQIDEGHGRMITRFCQGLDEMLSPILRWTRAGCAFAIFALTTSTVALHLPDSLMLLSHGTAQSLLDYERDFLILGGTALLYVIAMSVVVWFKVRVRPWSYLPAIIPAMLVAASGQSVEAALPLTMDGLRRRAGISNRVAGVALPLCAVLQRDGMALGWASVALCLRGLVGGTEHGSALIYTVFAALLVGVGLGALSARSGLVPCLFLGVNGWTDATILALVLTWVVATLGGAVSVFTHACVAVIIAREEGEYWVPGPQPASDEIQGLINQQALAES